MYRLVFCTYPLIFCFLFLCVCMHYVLVHVHFCANKHIYVLCEFQAAAQPKPLNRCEKIHTIDYVGKFTQCAKNVFNWLAGGGPTDR
jgi:hypothetical protein